MPRPQGMEDPVDYQKSWKKYKSGVEDMPNVPWDDANVAPNLLTLSRLRSGDKLSVLSSTANPGLPQFQNLGNARGLRNRFAIQKGGFFKLTQAIERTKKGENILDDNQYLIPLRNLFTRAKALFIANQPGIQLLAIKNAYNGLSNMLMTYQREKNSQGAMKIIAIQQILSPLIPKEGDRNVIVLRRGYQAINLFQYTAIWPNLNNTVLQFLNLDNNALARTEQGLGSPPQSTRTVTPEVIQQVILETPAIFRTTQATTLPTLTAPYVRQGLGVCKQFPIDWLRSPPIVDGVLMGLEWDDLRKLFVALKNDEGMFFLVSQLCCQVGMEAIPSLLFGHRNQQNVTNGGRLEFVFYYNDLFWYPNKASNREKYITTTKKEIEIKVVTLLDGMFFSSETMVPDQMNIVMKTPFSLSVTSIVALRRKANAISMRLVKYDVGATCT